MSKRKKNQGRHYQIGEWVSFEQDGYLESTLEFREHEDLEASDVELEISKKLQAVADAFTEEANRVVRGWADKHPDKAVDLVESDDFESDDDIAWNTWADLVGHGVGFWENMNRSDYESLEKAIEADKKLGKAMQRLEDGLMVSVDEAVERASSRSGNPSKGTRKLKSKLLR